MSSFDKLHQEQPAITAIAIMTQDYVLFDEEFSANKKIQQHLHNQLFWLDISQAIYNNIVQLLTKDVCQNDGVDEHESIIPELTVYNYVLNSNNRITLNDVICDAVESWIAFH